MITIGIIEDLDDYRNLLNVLFNNSNDTAVLFSTGSAEDAMRQIQLGDIPTVCIVDINLPGSSGIDLVKWIRKSTGEILCLMCTAYDSDDKVFQSLEAGAHGYILKSTSPAAIVEAVKEVCSGGSPMSSEIARKVVSAFSKKESTEIDYLTNREHEILEQLSRGLFYKEIAALLKISIETVKRHCFNIYQKLHVQNRTEAINKFRKQ